MNALVNNESLPTAEFKFWRPVLAGPTGGSEQQYFTIKLTNASIASSNLYHPDSYDGTAPAISNGSSGGGQELEEYSLTYQKIQWTWVDGGITAEDDWEAPVA